MLTTGPEGPPIVSMFLYVVHNNFILYRALGFKSLVTLQIKEEKEVT